MTAPTGDPRPIKQQTWRSHHTGCVDYTAELSRAFPAHTFAPSPTSGCQRRRRKAIERRHDVEDAAFYRDGTIPASSTSFTMCPCGARAFARAGEILDDFHDTHSFCDEVSA